MCQASKLAPDWVTKGCHVHIGAVEISIFPDHKGGLGFRPFFTVTSDDQEAVTKALKTFKEECLPDAQTRSRWIRSLDQATVYMLSIEGELATRANGRMIEFKFLSIALDRYGK